MRSAAEYTVQLREQLEALKRRLELLSHRQFDKDESKILLRFLSQDFRFDGECAAISVLRNPVDERAVRVSPGYGLFIHGQKEAARWPRFA